VGFFGFLQVFWPAAPLRLFSALHIQLHQRLDFYIAIVSEELEGAHSEFFGKELWGRRAQECHERISEIGREIQLGQEHILEECFEFLATSTMDSLENGHHFEQNLTGVVHVSQNTQ
jgi:hypothetical protein